MNPLHDFLTWFDGWAENIDKAPTAKQWERTKAKVEQTRAIAPGAVSQVSPAAAPAPPPPPAKPTTPTAWKAQYQGALMELGLDPESAKEYAQGVAVAMDRSPAAVAKETLAEMLN